jgi:hypothetical protein
MRLRIFLSITSTSKQEVLVILNPIANIQLHLRHSYYQLVVSIPVEPSFLILAGTLRRCLQVEGYRGIILLRAVLELLEVLVVVVV